MILPYPLTARQQRFVALGDELAARFAARAAVHEQHRSFPFENYADLHERGYLRLVLPPAVGGEGADLFELVLAQERLGRGDGGTALATGMSLSVLGRLVEERTLPEPIFQTIVETIATEGGLINSVVTEPELGSVSRGGVPSTAATRTDGGWLINGHKTFATGAPVLRYLLTGVQLPATDAAPEGVVANAIVRAGSPGLRLEDTWSGNLSMRTSGSYDVHYESVFVPDDWVVDQRALGAPLPPSQRPGLSGWGLLIAATYLGIGQAACDAACAYANGRVPSSLGTPIAELPHIQQAIGAAQAQLDAARALLYHTARCWVEHAELRPALVTQLAAAKYLCTNAACAAGEHALRVAGGNSLSARLPIERHFRDARAGLFNPPQDDLALAQVGRAALAAQRAAAATLPSDAGL